MNLSKVFLKNKLEALAQTYSKATIKYFLDIEDKDHFICVHPDAYLNSVLDNEALIIYREFRKNFPTESLSFIELDSDLNFDEMVFEYNPKTIFDSNNFKFIPKVHINYNIFSSYSKFYHEDNVKIMIKKPGTEDQNLLIVAGNDEFALAA